MMDFLKLDFVVLLYCFVLFFFSFLLGEIYLFFSFVSMKLLAFRKNL